MPTGLFVTCILGTLAHPTLGAWISADLSLQYFKSTHEEAVYRVSSKSPNMSTGLFVACVLGNLAHPAQKAWISAYLSLQYFKSTHEEAVYRDSSKSLQQYRVYCQSAYVFSPTYPRF
ncbi:hypothetical protein AVEN_121649-1 [Araneus ventricosus]|uniref:Uncharacterized protein n=1 Tax=Araneus ventricosus TaxID=182803 RepID=A0A4Y2KU14_ARAVE|nr:hypothetical protein AVEN_121649-1 [Araneus ventricosus]